MAVSDRTRAVAACTWTVVVARSEDSDGVFGPWGRVPRRWATVWTLEVEVHAVPVGWFFIFIKKKGGTDARVARRVTWLRLVHPLIFVCAFSLILQIGPITSSYISIPVERSIGKSFEGAFYRQSALWRRHGVARWVSWVTRYLGAYTHVVRGHVVRGITRGRCRSTSGPRLGARPIWVQAHGRH